MVTRPRTTEATRMNPTRLLPLISLSVVLAGCGARAGIPATSPPASNSDVGTTDRLQHSPSPSVNPSPTVTPPPQPAPEKAVLVVESPESGGAFAVSLVDSSGRTLASASIAN